MLLKMLISKVKEVFDNLKKFFVTESWKTLHFMYIDYKIFQECMKVHFTHFSSGGESTKSVLGLAQ